MGRYAFFNTEFEYKFWFAIQSSKDITEFYGDFDEETEDEGMFCISWNSTDMERIKKKLERIRTANPILPEVRWEDFEGSVDGTHDVRDFLYDKDAKGVHETVIAKYILGCLIYHQLLYTPDLTCRFEG
jgi:hypothetical protein